MKNILVRAPQWLGDAVVSTVFLNRLKTRCPDDVISVLCTPALKPLFESHPAVTGVIELPYPHGNVFEAVRRVRDKKFDEAYVLPRSFRAAFEAFAARVPVRIGYAGDMRRLLLTSAFHYDASLLYAHRYLKLIDEPNLALDSVKPYFPSKPPADPELVGLKKPWIGVAPVSIAPSRMWDPVRFAEAAKRLQQRMGGSVILFGSGKERMAVQNVADRIGADAVNTAGRLNLPELGAIVSGCRILLANDSGLMHVASAFNIPTVVLFGASDPSKALPAWGRFSAIQHKEIFCVPCLKNHCVRLGDDTNACLKAISVDEAVNEAERIASAI